MVSIRFAQAPRAEDIPMRRSSSCRRGFGSSFNKGSVKRLGSGSGGQLSEVNGLRKTSFLDCSSLFDPHSGEAPSVAFDRTPISDPSGWIGCTSDCC